MDRREIPPPAHPLTPPADAATRSIRSGPSREDTAGAAHGPIATSPTLPPAGGSQGAAASEDPAAADDPLIGTLVADRYRLVAKLGSGGMGAVYKGEHVSLRKRVAVKLLHREMSANAEIVARFEREAVAAANLDHPNVVGATDYGRLPDGTFFMVMEFVDGRSLRRVLEEEPRLAPQRALKIARQIASALARAHAKDIVHRDLKPENVVVCARDGDPDFVKVIDFGIARVTNSSLTQLGSVFGTPEYMAPEQALGQGVDARADQYALGVMAYEMLGGRRPFEAEDAIDVLRMHVGATPPPLVALAPELPPAASDVVARMMAKRPADRFESVTAAAEALAAAIGASNAYTPLAPAAHGARTPTGALAPQATGFGAPAPAAVTGAPAAPPPSGVVVSPSGVAISHAPASAAFAPPSVVPAPPPSIAGFPSVVAAPPRAPSRPIDRTKLGVALGVAGLAVISVIVGVATSGGSRGATRASVAPQPQGGPQPAQSVPVAERMLMYGADPLVRRALTPGGSDREFEDRVAPLRARRAERPTDGLAAYYLGVAYYRRHLHAEVVRELRAALALEPGLATDTTLQRALVMALAEAGPESGAEALLDGPLAAVASVAELLATEACTGATPHARGRVLDLAYQRRGQLSPFAAARVRLRYARDCAELTTAIGALEAFDSGDARADVAAVRRGDCGMLRLDDGCRACTRVVRAGRAGGR